MRGKIFYMATHCHLNNDHVCDFCDDEKQPVVGCIQYETEFSKGMKYTLLHYCAKCVLHQAQKMAAVVHPSYRVKRINQQAEYPCEKFSGVW